jgi:hypothetical protein
LCPLMVPQPAPAAVMQRLSLESTGTCISMGTCASVGAATPGHHTILGSGALHHRHLSPIS